MTLFCLLPSTSFNSHHNYVLSRQQLATTFKIYINIGDQKLTRFTLGQLTVKPTLMEAQLFMCKDCHQFFSLHQADIYVTCQNFISLVNIYWKTIARRQSLNTQVVFHMFLSRYLSYRSQTLSKHQFTKFNFSRAVS